MHNATLAENFRRYIERHRLFTHDDRILLTVSGGVDSMVMLSLFVEAGYNVGVAHCNFCLRGKESDEDEVLVRNEAERLGVVCYNRRFDTTGEMERTGESMEMAARRLRYDWFYELCRTEGYTVIAVAHHIDDSIETFFINLLRGTGLRGLTGIKEQRDRVVRPLLFASRKEILEYAARHHIPYREDSSNRSTKYLRNKIRLGLVPMIREICPGFTALMRGNLYRLSDARLFIDRSMAKIGEQIIEKGDGFDTIHISRIEEGFPHNFIIYELLSSRYGFKGDVVDDLCTALSLSLGGRRFYSMSYVAVINRDTIVVAKIDNEDPCESLVEASSQRVYCGNSVLRIERTDIDNIATRNLPSEVALLDADKLQFPLRLRRWKEGDSFIPFGMTGRKKVSDFLIDQKLSLIEKNRQFVLLSGEEIVWIVGRRIDERFRLGDQTENVLRITREIL